MRVPRWWKLALGAIAVALALGVAIVAWVTPSLFGLLAEGDTRDLRDQPEATTRPGEPTAFILALDGVDRAILYEMLREGSLPNLAALIGGIRGGAFPHAHLDDTALAPMPTSTLASWATIFTGTPPGVHGVTGNEYFIRAERRFAAPAPVSIFAPDLVLQTYTDGYANKLLGAPTLYERLRTPERDVSSWVCMSQFFRGADRLLLADRTVLAEAFETFLDDDDDADDLEVFADLDREVVENLVEELRGAPAPGVLTLYLSGPDHYAHGSDEGPDRARRRYLRVVVDGLVGDVARALDARGALEDRHVIIVSDHGHTPVVHDATHALSTAAEDDPPAVVKAAGFQLRPFEMDAESARYDAVLAYGGALAYAYVADRSSCERDGCDWSRPPRFDEDVVPLAEAFLAASREGAHAPSMRGALDLVLVRPRDGQLVGEFVVYLGDGKTESLKEHLERDPRRTYVDVADRMHDLAVGPRGDHAGDIILVANNGSEVDVAKRFYFSSRYYSWHGSPSRTDSEIPFIVAHRGKTSAELALAVKSVAGDRVDATEITPVIQRLMRDARSQTVP